jgi:predicted DNA-binding protein with PD1-like motif
MRYCETSEERVFVIRLEDRENIQQSIEDFAFRKNILYARVQMLGGVDKGSILIAGASEGRAEIIEPMRNELKEMHEAVGNGTIFPDSKGMPRLHCHLACGRQNNTVCGEIRDGVFVWHVMEVIITELSSCDAYRKHDPSTGFELLYPGESFNL